MKTVRVENAQYGIVIVLILLALVIDGAATNISQAIEKKSCLTQGR